MGEYATVNGESVKIGTCENMYYLRFDQRHQVTAERGNVDPVADAPALRFRFPWPDEDTIPPGSGLFHDNGYERAIAVPDMQPAEGVEHYTVQFSAQAGYLVSLPCPESSAAQPAHIHRNGFSGAVQLVYQKYREGIGLVPVLKCGGCGAMWRVEERSEIEEIAMKLRSAGDRRQAEDVRNGHKDTASGQFWHAIADRLLAGIEQAEAVR